MMYIIFARVKSLTSTIWRVSGTMPPEYHLKSFWDKRFENESHFEWLGDGQDTILPPLRSFLEASPHVPRLLHAGAGSSTLSDRILLEYQNRFGDEMGDGIIVNTDFSKTVVDKWKEVEENKPGRSVLWEQANMQPTKPFNTILPP